MIGDRNKTELTRNLTAAVYRYLDERGFKPVETEVPVSDGWVADLAGVISPTMTELAGLKLVKRRPKWNQPGYKEWWPATKALQQLMTMLVEVKTSRSDFRGDKKWTLPVPANLAYLAIPSGLKISAEELPQGWGVLEYNEASGGVRLSHVPTLVQVTTAEQLDVVLQVAIRRDHHTRYEREREFRKEMTAGRNEDISRTRFLAAMRAMKSIVAGEHGDVRTALEYHSIKNIPEYYLKELDKLFGVAVQSQNPKGKANAATGN